MNIGSKANIIITEFEFQDIIYKNIPIKAINYNDTHYIGYIFGIKFLIDKRVCIIK